VIVQDELRNLLTLDRELYSVAYDGNGAVPDYLRSVERRGALVSGAIPKQRLYDFMDLTRSAGFLVHECSLKKTSLEESFFNIIKGGGEPQLSEPRCAEPVATRDALTAGSSEA
jgi:hypothetical protein